MNTVIHTTLRSLAMAASCVSMPVASQLSRQIARQTIHYILTIVPEQHLPSLTQVMIVGQAKSITLSVIALLLAAALAIMAWKLNNLAETNPWKHTGQILVTYFGLCFSLLVIVFTLMAAFLPSMGVIQSIGD